MSHGRKNGEKQSQPICVWNGILEKKHRDRMGRSTALWLYLEMLDKITLEDSQGVGWLLGKKPIKIKEFEGNILTNREHFRTLRRFGYITAKRTPYGYIIGVTKTLKLRFGRVSNSPHSGLSKIPQSLPQSEQFCSGRVSNSAHYKEDNAVDNAVKARAADSPIWRETGVNPLSVPGPFRELCEDFWPTRNGASLFDFMGSTLDAWAALGNKHYPPAWVRRKAEIGRAVKEAPRLPELEDIPWQK